MGNLIPGEPLIYTRANGVVYARYRDPPHNQIPKWIIGGDPTAVAQAQGDLLSYGEWQKLCELSHEHLVLRKLLEKLISTYYLIKEPNK